MQDMMGGFFGYEPMQSEGGDFSMNEGENLALVSSGRAALEVLLNNLPQRPRCVWIPRMVCDTVLQAPQRLGLPIRRYGCDEHLRPLLPEPPGEADVLILINYFGLTGKAVADAAAGQKCAVLVDATTALHAPLPMGANGLFYSFRKFLPVADGGAAIARYPLLRRPLAEDDSSRRMNYLHLRAERGARAAAAAAQEAEDSLCAPPKRISPQTAELLHRCPTADYAVRRRANYRLLHETLAPLNRLHLPDAPPAAPQCYPFVSGIPDLRDSLVDAGIALPLYWPEVIAATAAHETENILSRTLLPLPLDQRYGTADMEHLLHLILG